MKSARIWMIIAPAAAAILACPAAAWAACPAGDEECTASQPVADAVIRELDEGHANEIWDQNASAQLKGQVSKDDFLASSAGPIGILGVGVKSRTVVQQGPAADPSSGAHSYGRLFRVILNNDMVYFETLSLLNEAGSYKMLSLFFYPAPAS
jgi:hypothetical protein